MTPRENGDQRGQSLVEYAFVVSFLVILVVLVFTALTPTFNTLVTDATSEETVGNAKSALKNELDEDSS